MRGLAKQLFIEREGKAPWGCQQAEVVWPYIEELVAREVISYFDYALAKALLKNGDEDVALAVVYLSLVVRCGHLCVSLSKMTPHPVAVFNELSNASETVTDGSLFERVKKGLEKLPKNLVSEEKPTTPFFKWNEYLYIQKYWLYETQLIENYLRLERSFPEIDIDPEKVQKSLDQMETLLPEQRAAVALSLSKSVSIISGGPGTGKSYTAGVLIDLFCKFAGREVEVVTTAPTGKAAAHLESCISHPFVKKSKTLHALLGINPSRFKPIKETEKLSADFVLVDESSMIDIKMMAALLSAIKPGARLVLLGDPFQLPPVENGHVFGDLITLHRKKEEPIGYLKTCLRAELKGIVEFSQAVNRADLKKLSKWDFEGVSRRDLGAVDFFIEEYVKEFSADLTKLSILSPFRQGLWGVNHLNKRIFEKISKKKLTHFPIIIVKNDLSLELFNGDVGLLLQEEKCALFSGRKIPLVLLPKFEYAFCISVHKSQGSEYQKVKLLIPPGSEKFGREVLYTGATRARRELELWGDQETILQTVMCQKKRQSAIVKRCI